MFLYRLVLPVHLPHKNLYHTEHFGTKSAVICYCWNVEHFVTTESFFVTMHNTRIVLTIRHNHEYF